MVRKKMLKANDSNRFKLFHYYCIIQIHDNVCSFIQNKIVTIAAEHFAVSALSFFLVEILTN